MSAYQAYLFSQAKQIFEVAHETGMAYIDAKGSVVFTPDAISEYRAYFSYSEALKGKNREAYILLKGELTQEFGGIPVRDRNKRERPFLFKDPVDEVIFHHLTQESGISTSHDENTIKMINFIRGKNK